MDDDDDLVALTMHGLGQEYKPFDTPISVRLGGMPDFNELVALLIVEELKLGLGGTRNTGGASSSSNDDHARNQALYSSRGYQGRGRFSPRGRDGRGWNDRSPQPQQNQNF